MGPQFNDSREHTIATHAAFKVRGQLFLPINGCASTMHFYMLSPNQYW